MDNNNIDLVRARKANPLNYLVLSLFSLTLFIVTLGAEAPAAVWLLFLALAGLCFWRFLYGRKVLAQVSPEIRAKIKAEVAQALKARSQGALVMAQYQAGYEELGLKGTYELSATDANLVLMQSGTRIELPWRDLENVDAGTEDELRSRITLTRLAFLGLFALALKKERKQDFYVTITGKTGMAVFNLVAMGKNQQIMSKARQFSVACNSHIKAANARQG